ASAAGRSPTGRPTAPGNQGGVDPTPRCRRSQRCERSCGRKVTSLAIRAKLTEVPELPPGHARRARGHRGWLPRARDRGAGTGAQLCATADLLPLALRGRLRPRRTLPTRTPSLAATPL